MSPRWASARHCHHALKALLNRLHTQPASEIPIETAAETDARPNMNSDEPDVTCSDTSRATKRKRVEETSTSVTNIQGSFANSEQSLVEDVSTWPSWTPVLQYNGPDFGFDALHLGFPQSGGQPFGDFDLDNTGLFTDMGVSFVKV
ncbi:hypothetical protein BJ166DRAFT_157217 [Pestalotiopsis sp. NC0098]|nr:hypothetical protein BJ166DRAFT_157217 [Pestalotiopsis sp. NC0098]